MSRDSTPFGFPSSVRFPVEIHSIKVAQGQQVEKRDVLLVYSHQSSNGDKHIANWESPTSGQLANWKVQPGSRVYSSKDTVVEIVEPCKHEVQWAGVCALCGTDLTRTDYSGISNTARAAVKMVDSSSAALSVSVEEAARLDSITTSHLLRNRKLSLIVDLDQTIIQATVDPTIGAWMEECGLMKDDEEGSTTPKAVPLKPEGEENEEDVPETAPVVDNPNKEALKDIGCFRLSQEIGQPLPREGLSKDDYIYYVKPRPGLTEFFQKIAQKYELSVYTMGTRAYAARVCHFIDPTKQIFGERIISRDENGSLTEKDLGKVFPVDKSMVVVIDDRSDVWQGSRNLVKVVPYDFFIGIGDINAVFLPKLPDSPFKALTPSATATTSVASPSTPEKPAATTSLSASDADEEATPASLFAFPSTEQTTQPTSSILAEQNKIMSAQVEEKGLAKMQEELNREVSDSTEPVTEQTDDGDEVSPSPSPPPGQNHHKALLNPNDDELVRVGEILDTLHKKFFEGVDAKREEVLKEAEDEEAGVTTSKRLTGKGKEVAGKPDVAVIIDNLKSSVLAGCVILFSGVIPLGAAPERDDIWKTAVLYGATCVKALTKEVTHIVAKQLGTDKVRAGLKKKRMNVVYPTWLSDSAAAWKRLPEEPYLLQPKHPDEEYSDSDNDEEGDGTVASSPIQSDTPAIPLEMGVVDWASADQELEDFLNEDDSQAGDDDDSDLEEVANQSDTGSVASTSGMSTISRRRGNKRSRRSSVAPSPAPSRLASPAHKKIRMGGAETKSHLGQSSFLDDENKDEDGDEDEGDDDDSDDELLAEFGKEFGQ